MCEHTEYYAHTPNQNGAWHLLRDHLQRVACLASSFASSFGADNLGRVIGVLHDIGKASREFQHYLQQCYTARLEGRNEPPHGPDHKLAGARLAYQVYQPLVLPILGHHGGLVSLATVRSLLCSNSIANQHNKHILHALGVQNILQEQVPIPDWVTDKNATEFFIRMLFSVLVDADFLDAESHWEPEAAGLRGQYHQIDDLWELFQENQQHLMNSTQNSLVNECRREIYQECLRAAEHPPGVFLLTVPTGGGKTRSAMAFALRHALKHGLRRIVVALPYTSIIDQNVQVYREIFGRECVIEHHSAIHIEEADEYSEAQQRQLLAMENWDAPIVVTTTVQLFESLFSNKPSKCRKIHNLARSVIILDEVQTLPVGLLQPILDILKELVRHYNVTLVLSTATHPALNQNSRYICGFDGTREIVENPAQYFETLRRVNYTIELDPWDWEQAANEIRGRDQVLCVLNSRLDALTLYRLVDDPDAFHLSTLMCPAHRRDTLDEIRRRLSEGLPCKVISTQVVEAGVDLDFPCVMRALGPLDRIVQAAGRCNREGLLGCDGEVILFNPHAGRTPHGPYATATCEAQHILSDPECDLHDPRIFEEYFSRLWQDTNLDVHKISELRTHFDYPRVAESFRMIDDEMISVIVNYGDPGPSQILARVEHTGMASRSDWRQLQQYCVGLYRRQFAQYQNQGLIHQIAQGVYVWRGAYNERYGLSEDLIDPADLIA